MGFFHYKLCWVREQKRWELCSWQYLKTRLENQKKIYGRSALTEEWTSYPTNSLSPAIYFFFYCASPVQINSRHFLSLLSSKVNPFSAALGPG